MRRVIVIGAAIGLLAVIVGVALHVSARETHACSAPAIPLEVTIERSDSIFRGRVVSIDTQIVNSDESQREVEAYVSRSGADGDVRVNAYENIVEFKVTEVWKGELYETIYVRSTWESIKTPIPLPCPPSFHSYVADRPYVVFAKGGQANVGSATKTRRVESATLILRELGDGKPPIPGSIGPIPERQGQPVVERPAGGCSLTPGYASGSINLSGIGLTVLLAWFWIHRRIRR